jgi:hypothetical protein
MTTRLGKILVVLTTALSWSLAVWAYGAYTLAIDWGWAPQLSRKDIENKRIPSEMDKRKAEVDAARAAAERAQAGLMAARATLHKTRMQFPANHLLYNRILNYLATGPGKIDVHEIQLDSNGKMVLTGNSPIGVPVFENKPIAGLNLSAQGLRAELRDLEGSANKPGQIDVQLAALKKLDKEQKAITERLSPLLGPNGQVIRKGLDDLAEVEAKTQMSLREEIDRLRPMWTRDLSNAQSLMDRRDGLRRRVEELRGVNKTAPSAQ